MQRYLNQNPKLPQPKEFTGQVINFLKQLTGNACPVFLFLLRQSYLNIPSETLGSILSFNTVQPSGRTVNYENRSFPEYLMGFEIGGTEKSIYNQLMILAFEGM